MKILNDLNDFLKVISSEGNIWLKNKINLFSENKNPKDLYLAFSLAPRHIGHSLVCEEPSPFLSKNWKEYEVARVILINSFPFKDEIEYLKILDSIFETAEVKELEALYKGLSFLPSPENLVYRATEGVRSNIGTIFEAIAINNPYPARYFDENSWNQMVIKAIFIGKSLQGIEGLDTKRNRELARMAIDLAHERWAAGRTVTPQLWRLAAPFLTIENIGEIERLLKSHVEQERLAAILCIKESTDPVFQMRVKDLISSTDLSRPNLSWDNIFDN